VFFEDEARFGRISREMACWVKRSIIPSVAKQMIREYIYAYSALSPQTGDCYSIISPFCNTEAMNEFLQQLSDQYKHYRIILILDKAVTLRVFKISSNFKRLNGYKTLTSFKSMRVL